MRVTRAECKALLRSFLPYTCGESPLQLGMSGDPWRVMVASMLLQRAKRIQARPVLRELLRRWSSPAELTRADTSELESVLRPCGLHRQRARQMQRAASIFISEGWEEVKDLPGVGAYTSDAVGLFCFRRTDLECDDNALRDYAAKIAQQAQCAEDQS